MSVMSEKSNIEQEFEDIENKKLWKIVLMSLREESEKITKNETFEQARKAYNRNRNRYRDVLPYDDTRVTLAAPDSSSPSSDSSSDYINASYVGLAHHKYGRRYILTQGPLASTVSHFWRMVWQQGCECIVMLNKLVEKDAVKCAQYYPTTEKESENHIYTDVDLSVTLVESEEVNRAYVRRVFLLQNEKTLSSRRVTQFHYQSWPDFGVPSSAEVFLQFLWGVRANGGLDSPDKPAVVHCSAGIGRSGTFVLIDLALLQIAEQRSCRAVNLQQMLIELRKCRIGLIQTAEQLRFAYSSVISGAKALLDSDIEAAAMIQFEEYCDKRAVEPIELSSSSEQETDSDFSENSDNNSALDKAAAAVRTRRGLPAKNDYPVIPLNNYNNKDLDSLQLDHTMSHEHHQQKSASCAIEHDRKIVREMRCNRTRKIIEDIRCNMRQQDLERDRILCRLGLNRLINSLARQNRVSLIAGASALVGFLSLACGFAVYKFVG